MNPKTIFTDVLLAILILMMLWYGLSVVPKQNLVYEKILEYEFNCVK